MNTVDALVIEDGFPELETVETLETRGKLLSEALFAGGMALYALFGGVDDCQEESVGAVETVAFPVVEEKGTFCAFGGFCKLVVCAFQAVL